MTRPVPYYVITQTEAKHILPPIKSNIWSSSGATAPYAPPVSAYRADSRHDRSHNIYLNTLFIILLTYRSLSIS